MKRVQSINCRTIFQARTQRDADVYDCPIGCYNIYWSSDIRDQGLSGSTPEHWAVEHMAEALLLCRACCYEIADALADELSDLDYHDADLASEIGRRLSIGDTIETIRVSYDRDDGRFHDYIPQEMVDEIRKIAVRVRDESNCRIKASEGSSDTIMIASFCSDWRWACRVIEHCDAGVICTDDRAFAKAYCKDHRSWAINPASDSLRDELITMINSAANAEELDVIVDQIQALDLPDDLQEEIDCEIMASYDMFQYRTYHECIGPDDRDYGPSNPWDAPGMKVSDFISGVCYI